MLSPLFTASFAKTLGLNIFGWTLHVWKMGQFRVSGSSTYPTVLKKVPVPFVTSQRVYF